MSHFFTPFRSTFSRLAFSAGLSLLGLSAHAQAVPTWASVQRSTSTGANNGSNGRSIAISADGSQYVTGVFGSNITLGTTTLTAGAGNGHVFVAKYSAAGTVLWASKIDAGSFVDGHVAVDAAGNVYLMGEFDSTVTLGSTTLTTASYDTYLVKYDAQGVQQWVRQGGGSGVSARGIATDASGNVLITGSYNSSVAFGGTALPGSGIFFYRFSPTGTVQVASRVAAQGFTYDLAPDNAGNTYLVGDFSGTATFGTTTLTSAGSSDIFLCKLSATGAILWARRDGGTGEDSGSHVAVDANGNPMIGGYNDGVQTSSGGLTSKIYVARYNNQGTQAWTRQISPSVADDYKVEGITYDGRGGYYITGVSRGTAVFGTTTLTSVGENTYVARYDSQGTVQWASQVAGATANDASAGFGIAADGSGNVYVTGAIFGTVTFGSLPASTGSGVGSFLAKINAGGVIAATRATAFQLKLAAYPNPASETTTLVVPSSGELLLVDALGRTVRQQTLLQAGMCSVSLAGVRPGIYQLLATLSNGQAGRAQVVVR